MFVQTIFIAKSGVLPTLDSHKYTWDKPVHTNVKAIYTKNGFHSSLDIKTIHRSDSIDGNELMAVGIILEESPFYSEAGGQVYLYTRMNISVI